MTAGAQTCAHLPTIALFTSRLQSSARRSPRAKSTPSKATRACPPGLRGPKAGGSAARLRAACAAPLASTRDRARLYPLQNLLFVLFRDPALGGGAVDQEADGDGYDQFDIALITFMEPPQCG